MRRVRREYREPVPFVSPESVPGVWRIEVLVQDRRGPDPTWLAIGHHGLAFFTISADNEATVRELAEAEVVRRKVSLLNFSIS